MATESQTKTEIDPAANGSSGKVDPSARKEPGQKTYEEVLAENESLRGSVRGLTEKQTRYEDELKSKRELEAETERLRQKYESGNGQPAGDDLLTPEEQAAIDRRIDQRIEAAEKDRVRKMQEDRKRQIEFAEKRKTWLEKAEKEFPGSTKLGTELFQESVKIFSDPAEELASIVEGIPIPLDPKSEYDAIARAQARIASRGTVQADKKAGAGFSSTGGPGGSADNLPAKKGISDEEYQKMSPEEQRAHDEKQFESKFGGKK